LVVFLSDVYTMHCPENVNNGFICTVVELQNIEYCWQQCKHTEMFI